MIRCLENDSQECYKFISKNSLIKEKISSQFLDKIYSKLKKIEIEQVCSKSNPEKVNIKDLEYSPFIAKEHLKKIEEDNWSLIPSQSDVDVHLINSSTGAILASLLDQQIGCTNDTYIEYDSNNKIDNGSCLILSGDINIDNQVDVLDVVEVISLVLEGEYNYIVDINNDSLVDVLDIIQIINIVLS